MNKHIENNYCELPSNWEIFKKDTVNLAQRTKPLKNDTLDDSLYNIKYKNNLFGPIGLTFQDGYASAIEASHKNFDTKKEMSAWLNSNRPLVYMIIENHESRANLETFVDGTLKQTKKSYRVRFFPHASKLSWFKYKIQFLVGRYNFEYIRPFLYRYLVIK